jgi:myo-inositol-1(or 4)-monophosphatase
VTAAQVLALARALREAVLPVLGSVDGRRVIGDGAGGDITFAIDSVAESLLAEFISANAPEVAYYSEDRGLVSPAHGANAAHVLVVDPIDGTRPAMAGLESACVAVALAALAEAGSSLMRDVSVGCVVEIKSGEWFLAERGRGISCSTGRRVALSTNADISRMFWAYGFRGRPARPSVEVLGDLIDSSSVGGGTFELGSQAYAMTRIVTGQLDAVVEVGSRLIDDVPGMHSEFLRVGRGAVLNNSPYDLAAPWLCLIEAGGVVTDGWGRPLDDRPLLGSGHSFQMSSISACCPELHAQLLREVDAGVARLQQATGA